MNGPKGWIDLGECMGLRKRVRNSLSLKDCREYVSHTLSQQAPLHEQRNTENRAHEVFKRPV